MDDDLQAAVIAAAPDANWQIVTTVSARGCVVLVCLGDGTRVRREGSTRMEAESRAAQTVRGLATFTGFDELDETDLAAKLEASVAAVRSKRRGLRLIKGGRS